jgi:glycosyltransferase involved in cell wall biosynthesis
MALMAGDQGQSDSGERSDDYVIVVPVLNEALALPALLGELREAGLLARTVFVDNGSSDGGPALIAAAGATLLRESRRGYGFPCLAGACEAAARGALAVVFMEADGTDDPSQAPLLAAPVLAGTADLVAGSRRAAVLGRAEGRMPWHQRLGNVWLGLNLRLFFGPRLLDDAPFRAVRLELLERLRPEQRAYAFPSEVLAKARLAGARIAVREVRYRPRVGASKIAGSWRGSAGAVRDITWCLVRLRLLGIRDGAG